MRLFVCDHAQARRRVGGGRRFEIGRPELWIGRGRSSLRSAPRLAQGRAWHIHPPTPPPALPTPLPCSVVDSNTDSISISDMDPSFVNDSYELSQPATQTQPQTQLATQEAQSSSNLPDGLFGLLTGWSISSSELNLLDPAQRRAASSKPDRIELRFSQPVVHVGRGPRCQVRLDGKKISNAHAEIWYDESDGNVRLRDNSTNGTYVRNSRIAKGQVTVLGSGDTVVFGPPSMNPIEDFRYTFHGRQSVAERDKLFGPTSDGGGIQAKYEVMEQIGKGSFATVRRAIDRTTGEQVAVKIVSKARFAGNPKTMIMIRREIELMKVVKHVSQTSISPK